MRCKANHQRAGSDTVSATACSRPASFTQTTTCQDKTDVFKSFHFSCRSEKLRRKPGKAFYQQFEGKNLRKNSSALLILLSLLARQAFISYFPSFINYSKGEQEFKVNIFPTIQYCPKELPEIKEIAEITSYLKLSQILILQLKIKHLLTKRASIKDGVYKRQFAWSVCTNLEKKIQYLA